jgi:hypothetical protein
MASPAFGGLLEFGPETAETVAGVAVPGKVSVKVPGQKTFQELFLTGAGVRTKKVVLVKVDVYVGANYLDNGKGISAENPMAAIAGSKLKVMLMTFLRDIDNEKIRDSFSDALKGNGIDIEKVPYKNFLGSMRFDIKEKDRWAFIGMPDAKGAQRVILETPRGQIEGSGAEFADDIWKMWFQKPMDGGLEDLKEKLLGQKPSK